MRVFTPDDVTTRSLEELSDGQIEYRIVAKRRGGE
jgi:hypothetical protein